MVASDPATTVVMVKRWFRHNPPMSESHMKGILRQCEGLPSKTIREEVTADVEALWAEICEQREIQARKRAESTQIAIAVVTLVLVAIEWAFHIHLHRSI